MFFSNVIGFDGFIILLTIVNILLVALPTKKLSVKIQEQIKKVVYYPISVLQEKLNDIYDESQLDLQKLSLLHHKEERYHQIFVSITSILPLLGILGTVIALLNSANADIAILKSNFTSALTSTFWGLLGAIICKGVEGVISPIIEQNQHFLNLLLSRIDAAHDQ